MAKTHKGPHARGTIHYANEVTPYGENPLSSLSRSLADLRVPRNMPTLKSQVLSLMFMLNLQRLVTAISVCNRKKGKWMRGNLNEK